MARFKVEIETKNAAFDGGSAGYEISRILDDLANKISRCNSFADIADLGIINLYDVNGNKVGSASGGKLVE